MSVDRMKALEAALQTFVENVAVPDQACRCHISPPCNWCVEHSHMAEAVEVARVLLTHKPAQGYEELSETKASIQPATACVFLRITGPNSDGEYWLHLKNGDGPEAAGINLGGDHMMTASALLKAAAEGKA